MEPSLLSGLIKSYVEKQKEILEAVSRIEPTSFKSFHFNTSESSKEKLQEWESELRKDGIGEYTPVIYYFEVINAFDRSQICKTIKELKKGPGKSDRALPLVNRVTESDCTGVLYVGKTQTNFIRRFKQHLGFGIKSTYALHLSHWATGLDLKLHYASYNFTTENLYQLEYIEDILHASLKPILGRKGR